MNRFQRVAYCLYPIVIAAFICLLAAQEGEAAEIRKLQMSPHKPALITLALGRSTAISFFSRPEKVVAGSPESLEVNFLGKDVTLRPIGPSPGNLLVYTKSGRFVIHLKIGSESTYDDVVEVGTIHGNSKPIRLSQDSYRVVDFKVGLEKQFRERRVNERENSKNQPTLISAVLSGDDLRLESDSLLDLLSRHKPVRCEACVIRSTTDVVKISCSQVIRDLRCRGSNGSIRIERVSR